jgi:PAS domain-containing protein
MAGFGSPQSQITDFDAIAESVQAKLGCSCCLISVVDKQVLYALGATELEDRNDRVIPMQQTLCQHTVNLKHPVRVADATNVAWLQSLPSVAASKTGAYLGVPLVLGDGHVAGAVCALSESARDWSDEEVSYLAEMADLVANKIDLKLLRAEEQGLLHAMDEADRIIAALAQSRKVALSVHDANGDLLFANRGMLRAFGPGASGLAHLPRCSLSDDQKAQMQGGMEVRVAGQDGSEHWLHVDWCRTEGGLILCDWSEPEADAQIADPMRENQAG